ncbi:hypothetical protein DQ384_36405 [Sphaerisporangium album]|uniref:Uncharacterized protein n=1 Tax=Sphaerisporangium album TaxID=509200 RepID=A0A367EUZ0_9ACTN|nr:hypothetical protein [Sphaerisporangium album]RCG21944.1 hypothetical protein DQ384_36405 [Sphaerisporangium album]
MFDLTTPEESTVADAHAGDLIEITACTQPQGCHHDPGTCPRGWRPPVRLVTEPAPCPDDCGSLRCVAVDHLGHKIPVHAAPTRQTRVWQHGPTRRSA